MQADKNKIADLFNNQKQALPDDFWSSIQDQIPTYEEKKRKPFFLLPSCLAVAVCAIIVASTFAFIYFENKSVKNQKGTSNIALHTKEISTTRPEVIHSNGTKNDTIDTNQMVNQSQVLNNSNESNQAAQPSKITNSYTNPTFLSNNLTKKNNFERSSAANKNNDTEPIPVQQVLTKSEDKKENTRPSLHTELNQNNENARNQVANTAAIQQTSTQNLKLDSISAMAVLNTKYSSLQNENIFQPIMLKYIRMDHISNPYSIEIGYWAGLFTATMAKIGEGPSTYITKRKETESNFISHECSAILSKSLSKKFNAYAGLRFTNIQTLFDYSTDVEEVSLLVYKKGRRTIQSTQSLKMLDINLGVEYAYRLNRKFTIYPSAGIAYNLSMKTKGKFLDNNFNVSNINESEFYKKSVGFNLESSLKLGYDLNPKLQSFLSVSYRHYLSSFSHSTAPVDIHYNGIMFGLGLKYSL